MREINIPHLRPTGSSSQLIVEHEPFLMLAGEVQNSQFSSARYMKDIWPKLKEAHLNTVFGSVSWEQIEPREGQFDFSELDQVILDAGQQGLRLVLLWFGSFKNGASTYVPSWIKQNPRRYPRAELQSENESQVLGDVLSIFGTEAQAADARAFAALMAHLNEADGSHSTIIMVQVENEVGLLGDSRDRSPLAEVAWRKPVPKELLDRLRQDWPRLHNDFQQRFASLQTLDSSTVKAWNDLPGDRHYVEELFMAYHYALYVEQVASAGKAAYSLPLYTNVWQNYAENDSREEGSPAIVAGGGKPGDYPSGGGVTNVLDIWKLFAPSLDLIAPDIYLNDYPTSCAAYRHRGQPLLIPEQRRDEYGARRVWSAFGSYQCIGTAPFGIDTLTVDGNPFRRHYGLLSRVSRHIIDAQARDNAMVGFFFDELREDGSDPSPPLQHIFGGWELHIERSFVFGRPSAGSGIVIHKGGNQFILVGWGFQVRFEPTSPRARFAGLLQFQEQEVVDAKSGQLKTLRWLNGDETRSGKQAIMPSEDPDYDGFPICVTIPAHTGIALCEPYAILEDEL